MFWTLSTQRHLPDTLNVLLKCDEAMTREEAMVKAEMVAKGPAVESRRPWSTFPRGRLMQTHPAACNGKPAAQQQRSRASPASQSLTKVPHRALTSLSVGSGTTKVLDEHDQHEYQYRSRPNVPDHVLTSLSVVLGTTKASQDEHDQHVHALASYFASSVSYDSKLARLRTLMTLVTPHDASWQLEDSVLKDTLRFLTDRNFDWPHPEHSAHVILLELRAMCLYEKEGQSLIVLGGDVAAGCIVGAARLVEHGLAASVPLIHCGLDLAGNQVKKLVTPEQEPPFSPRAHVVTKTYTDAAKRATNGVRETARWTAHSLRDASTDSIHRIAQLLDQEGLGEKLVPNEGHRNMLVAAGTVGIASLGAAAIVGEAVFETTKAVAQKSAWVAADVVRHKYGESAGRVVEDASHTTGNILRTVAHVAMLETTVLAKAVGKNACKVQARRSHESDESGNSSLHAAAVSPESYRYPTMTKCVARGDGVEACTQQWTTGKKSLKALKATTGSESASRTAATRRDKLFVKRMDHHSFDSTELEDVELNTTQHSDEIL